MSRCRAIRLDHITLYIAQRGIGDTDWVPLLQEGSAVHAPKTLKSYSIEDASKHRITRNLSNLPDSAADTKTNKTLHAFISKLACPLTSATLVFPLVARARRFLFHPIFGLRYSSFRSFNSPLLSLHDKGSEGLLAISFSKQIGRVRRVRGRSYYSLHFSASTKGKGKEKQKRMGKALEPLIFFDRLMLRSRFFSNFLSTNARGRHAASECWEDHV